MNPTANGKFLTKVFFRFSLEIKNHLEDDLRHVSTRAIRFRPIKLNLLRVLNCEQLQTIET